MKMRSFFQSWFIPVSLITFGGIWYSSMSAIDNDIQTADARIRKSSRHLQHEFVQPTSSRFQRVAYHVKQAEPAKIVFENLYPKGNPPYRNIISDAKNQKKNSLLSKDDPSELRRRIEAVKKLKNKSRASLPRELRSAEGKQKALKMLTDTYKVFNKHLEISKQAVQDAVEKGTRTEKEINEALEAIEQMRQGRQMVIEKIQTVEQAIDIENEVVDPENEFQLPEDY